MDSVLYSQIYIFTILFLPTLFFKQSLIAHAQKKALYVLNTLIPIGKILLLLVLLPTYGIMGALMALFIVQIVHTGAAITFFMNMKSYA